MGNGVPQYDCPQCNEFARQLVGQKKQLVGYEKRISDLEAQVKKLMDLLEKSQRSGKRQAAPFRKGKKTEPQKPGRKPGDDYGKQAHRTAPPPEKITEVHQAPLPKCCPHCHSNKISPTHVDQQYQVELPVEPIYRQFDISVGKCQGCGSRIQGRHELQTSDALGAAASQLGPRLHALIALLNKKMGMSHGKIQSLLENFFQVSISRSQSCRSLFRTAERLEEAVESIRRSVRGSPQVVPDETGWRVDATNAWLHAIVGTRATYYEIDFHRDRGVLKRTIGENYSGTLVHDGWAPYDGFNGCEHQTCLAHLMRRCRELIESQVSSSTEFPASILDLLKDSLLLRDRRDSGELKPATVTRRVDQLLVRLMDLVTPIQETPANERLAKHLHKHRDQLFTFLLQPKTDATNWRAEQAIRPAVVNRKVWGGNRTWKGAWAQGNLMSVIVTLAQRARSIIDYLVNSLTSTTPVPLFAK